MGWQNALQAAVSTHGNLDIVISSVHPLRADTGLPEEFGGVQGTPKERERVGKSVPLG